MLWSAAPEDSRPARVSGAVPLRWLLVTVAGALVVDLARPGTGRAGAVVYALSLSGLYGASAAYTVLYEQFGLTGERRDSM